MHEAAIKGDTQILGFLFDSDLSMNDLNQQNNDGETPLFLSAAQGHYAGTESLLNNGKCKTVVNIIKHFTIVIYDSRVVIWGVFKSGMTLESQFTSVNCL